MHQEHCGIRLYHRSTRELIQEIPLTKQYFVGNIGCATLSDISPDKLCYRFFDGDTELLDPYARIVYGREVFGLLDQRPELLFCGMDAQSFDWEEDSAPCIPFEDSVLYCAHVRGFTSGAGSSVAAKLKGSFLGVKEKLAYLKELGITSVELMPVYEFDEYDSIRSQMPVEETGISEEANDTHEYRMNIWGYKEAMYFAPKMSYSATKHPASEFKQLVKSAHALGMEVILQFYFPDAVKQGDILEVLRYWVLTYHVDGFHLMGTHIPLTLLATEPLLANTKLLYYGFPMEEIYAAKEKPKFPHLAVSTDAFLESMRRFLKGDENMIPTVMQNMTYLPEKNGILRYMTNYYGFTLYDLVSYDRKHNEANGEHNRDGNDMNYSWNCGAEGETKKKLVKQLRRNQMRNAIALTVLSQGTPFFMAGDEDLNSQKGNNNPYCQDNEIFYKDWKKGTQAKAHREFFRQMLALRKAHPVLRKAGNESIFYNAKQAFPEISFHGEEAFAIDSAAYVRQMGILYGGAYGNRKGETESHLYIAMNMHWMEQKLALPLLPKGQYWEQILDTVSEMPFEKRDVSDMNILMEGRSIRVFTCKGQAEAPEASRKRAKEDAAKHKATATEEKA